MTIKKTNKRSNKVPEIKDIEEQKTMLQITPICKYGVYRLLNGTSEMALHFVRAYHGTYDMSSPFRIFSFRITMYSVKILFSYIYLLTM